MSRFYLGAIERAPDLAVGAVCDVDPARLEPFAGTCPTFGDATALLREAAVDAVVLDTPVPTHASLCREALGAGRHVCCEKPLALTRADARALLGAAQRAGLILFTAFHRRYNRNLPGPGALPLDGLACVEVRYLERIGDHSPGQDWYSAPASAGGGCIVDNGPNAVDVMRHLFGPMTVEAVEVRRSPLGVDMQATVRGRLGTGADAVILLDWDFDGEVKDLTVRWEDGREVRADMLGGFGGFKSSLHHEYDGVLEAFGAAIARGEPDANGFAATAWLQDVLVRADAHQ